MGREPAVRLQLSDDRNLVVDLLRVTEAGAIAASKWAGRGDKNGADGAAVKAMRDVISSIPMDGVVVIGEGEKDDAPMLYNGETVGSGSGPSCDVAVDPIDGTTLTSKGLGNAISVIAAAPSGTMFDPSAAYYMNKLVAGPDLVDAVDIRMTPAANIYSVAQARNVRPEDVTVCVLDRARHKDLIAEIRQTGARVKLISDGDVVGALLAATAGSGIDLLLGIGGTPEGVIAACAIKCLKGVFQGQLRGRQAEDVLWARTGHDFGEILEVDDLISGDDSFFVATGITDGDIARGVRFESHSLTTDSVTMRARSGTVRWTTTKHRLKG